MQRAFEIMPNEMFLYDYSLGDELFYKAFTQYIYNSNGRVNIQRLASFSNSNRETISKWRLFNATLQSIFVPRRQAFEEAIETMRKTWDSIYDKTPWQLRERGTSHQKEFSDSLEGILKSNFVRKTVGNLEYQQYTFELYEKARMHRDAVVTLLALYRYQRDNNSFPDSLEILHTQGYIKEMPQDIYGSGALAYKKTNNDFTLYSLSDNFHDDNGEHHEFNVKMLDTFYGKRESVGDYVYWPILRKK